jgi:hypothetical protein
VGVEEDARSRRYFADMGVVLGDEKNCILTQTLFTRCICPFESPNCILLLEIV